MHHLANKLVAGGAVFFLLAFAAYLPVLAHAFRRDPAQGILCLCTPFYGLYYLFARFDHPRRGLVTAGAVAALVLGLVLALPGGCMRLTGAGRSPPPPSAAEVVPPAAPRR